MAVVFSPGGDDGSDERGNAARDGAPGTGTAYTTGLRGLDGPAGVDDTSACGSAVGAAGADVPGESRTGRLVGVDDESGDQRGAFLFQRSLASRVVAGDPLPARPAACAGDDEPRRSRSAIGGG